MKQETAEARRRLRLAENAKERQDFETARYHANKGLGALGRPWYPSLPAEELIRMLSAALGR